MSGQQHLAARFEEHRARLKAVAYRMLGSLAEADEVVQDAWLRLSRSSERTDASEGIENLGGWLTTTVSRLCLDVLHARKVRAEELVGVHIPDPIVSPVDGSNPERDRLLSDAVGLALQVVLDTLPPGERLAFVLHDLFDLPFEEVATIMDRSVDAARQLASRARRRVQSEAPTPDPDVARQRAIVDAFFAATRGGDLDALLALLAPDAVLRSTGGAARPALTEELRGAENIARGLIKRARPTTVTRPVLVNGTAGVVLVVDGRPVAVVAFTIAGGKVVAIDAIGDPDRLSKLGL